MREVVVGACQLGPIQRAEGREAVIERMLALLHRAAEAGCTLAVFPELALTTFFPRWMMEDPAEIDRWFERSMPNPGTEPLFQAAREREVGLSFGYAELTPDGHHFNTSILTDREGRITGKYRKVHLPGHAEYDPERDFQHLEKRYFDTGDLGFPVWRAHGGILGMCICNDRRWPETYRVMGLQGVEMVLLGFNTPTTNSQSGAESPDLRNFHHRLSVQSGAYQNATWVVAVAKAGIEDGHALMGGTLVCGPDGAIAGELEGEEDGLLVVPCDLDRCAFGKRTIFDFALHRRPEHYGMIVERVGAEPPPD